MNFSAFAPKFSPKGDESSLEMPVSKNLQSSTENDRLRRAIEYFSELQLNESEIEKCFSEFSLNLRDPEKTELRAMIEKMQAFTKKGDDLELFVKTLNERVDFEALNSISSKLADNEMVFNYALDFFLEKVL